MGFSIGSRFWGFDEMKRMKQGGWEGGDREFFSFRAGVIWIYEVSWKNPKIPGGE